jgi:TRAP-type C4-dicarboxylate transport system substrate-binding protein
MFAPRRKARHAGFVRRIMSRSVRIFSLVGIFALVPPVWAQSASPAKEWKLSTTLGPAYPQGKAGEVWARLINERSRGRLAVKHFPGATLAQRDPVREFVALRDGVIDLAVGSASNWSSQVKELSLVGLPWLFPDRAALERVLKSEVGARMSERIEAEGIVPLASVSDAFRELATKRPVHAPADLAGLRLRVPAASLLSVDTLIALGALPAGMSASDARAALGRGALDGEMLGVAAFSATRLYVSGAPHLLLWGGQADALFFAINRALWDALPESDRQLVRQAAIDAAHEAGALAQRQTDEAALAQLARDGAKVTRLTASGKEPFRSATRTVYDKWAAIVGAGLVRAAEVAVGSR